MIFANCFEFHTVLHYGFDFWVGISAGTLPSILLSTPFYDRALYQTKTPIKFASGVLSEVLYVAYGRLSLCVTHDVRHRRIQLVGELSSSLGASSLKNFSTVSGCHSLSETVFLFSLSLLGLICSLHFGTSFIKKY